MIKKREILVLAMLLCLICLGAAANAKKIDNESSRGLLSPEKKGIRNASNKPALAVIRLQNQEILRMEKTRNEIRQLPKIITPRSNNLVVIPTLVASRPSRQMLGLSNQIITDFQNSKEDNEIIIEIYKKNDPLNPIWIDNSIKDIRGLRSNLRSNPLFFEEIVKSISQEKDHKIIILEINENSEVDTKEYFLSIQRP